MKPSHSSNSKTKDFIDMIKDEKHMVHAYLELSENANLLRKELVSANNEVGSDDSSTAGKTLIKAGTCLIAFPEPVISDIVGTALVVTGFALNRLGNRNNVRELCREHQKSLQDMQRLQREICQTTFFR